MTVVVSEGVSMLKLAPLIPIGARRDDQGTDLEKEP